MPQLRLNQRDYAAVLAAVRGTEVDFELLRRTLGSAIVDNIIRDTAAGITTKVALDTSLNKPVWSDDLQGQHS